MNLVWGKIHRTLYPHIPANLNPPPKRQAFCPTPSLTTFPVFSCLKRQIFLSCFLFYICNACTRVYYTKIFLNKKIYF